MTDRFRGDDDVETMYYESPGRDGGTLNQGPEYADAMAGSRLT